MSFIAPNEGINNMMMKMCATISDVRQKPNKKKK